MSDQIKKIKLIQAITYVFERYKQKQRHLQSQPQSKFNIYHYQNFCKLRRFIFKQSNFDKYVQNNKSEMFSQFQQMFKKVTNLPSQVINQDLSLIPQKYNFGNKQIQQLKLLSQGAFGFIWLAEDTHSKKQYALKRVICMTPQRLKEAQQQKHLMSIFPKSQNIVQYIAGDTLTIDNNKVVVTVMELCKGGTLFDILQKKQNIGFTENQLIKIATHVTQGLIAIHSTGYYHRDVKIQNVLSGENNNYKLCDFGSCTKQIVKFSQINPKEYDHIREQIQSLTTPMYRPPQIADPYLKYTVNEKVDMWMLGCVLYTLSYFTHPFLDANNVGIASGSYRFPKYPSQTKYQVTQKVKDLIRNLLTPNPSYRPSAKQTLQLLKNWNNFNKLKLNVQAQRRKKQQIEKEKEMQQLNRKVVDIDGDIPIQKLMELQMKLKNKIEIQQKPTSFINSKAIQKLKQQNNRSNIPNNAINQNKPQNNSNSFQNQEFFAKQNKPKQEVNIQNLWGSDFLNSGSKSQNIQQKNTNSFDAFSDFSNFGKATNQVNNNKKNQINFQQLFQDTSTSVQHSNQTKTNNISQNSKNSKNQDLLDL